MNAPKVYPQTKLVDGVTWSRAGDVESWQAGRLFVWQVGHQWFWKTLGATNEHFGPWATFAGCARAAMRGDTQP